MAGSEEVARRIYERRHRMIAALVATAQNVGARMQAAGQRTAENGGAPWKDKTGHARQGLFSSVVFIDNKIKLRYAHTVEYGVQLENGYSGKYAELGPRTREYAPVFLEQAERIVKA